MQWIILGVLPLQEAEPIGLKENIRPGKFTYVRHMCGLVGNSSQAAPDGSFLSSPHMCRIKVQQWVMTPELLRSFPYDFSKASGCLEAKRKKIKVRVK